MSTIRLGDDYGAVRFLCYGDGTHARHWTRPQLKYVQRDSAGALRFSMELEVWLPCQGVLEGDVLVHVPEPDPEIPDGPTGEAPTTRPVGEQA